MAGKSSGKSSGSSKSGDGHYRSAKSGQYVTEKYGKSHPATTVKETNKK